MNQQNTPGPEWQPDYFAVQSAWLKNPTTSSDFHLRYQPLYQSPYADDSAAGQTTQQDGAGVEEGADRRQQDGETNREVIAEPEDTIFRRESGYVREDLTPP